MDCDFEINAEGVFVCQRCRSRLKLPAAMMRDGELPKMNCRAAEAEVDGDDEDEDNNGYDEAVHPAGQGLPPQQQVTAVVTAFLRPESLQRCLTSVRRAYPELPIVVVDTSPAGEAVSPPEFSNVQYLRRPDIAGNLSAARNAGVAECKTPFAWIMEDDFELMETKGGALERMLDVLDAEPTVGVACGGLIHRGAVMDYACDLNVFRGELNVTMANGPWRATRTGTLYRGCDMGFNFFIVRREVAAECQWDESLPLGEHTDWFLRLKEQQQWRVAFCADAIAKHHSDRNEEYTKWRGRAVGLKKEWLIRRGLDEIVRQRVDAGSYRTAAGVLPNVVVLGTGRCGSTVLMKQLAALGWNVGRADEEYGENVDVRWLNVDAKRGFGFRGSVAREALARLPQPWAIKDPRFCETLRLWLPVLVDYEPMLVVVERDGEKVKESLRRQGWDEAAGERRAPLIDELLEAWPWRKVRVQYGRLALAASLFDVQRAATGGELPTGVDLGFRPGAELERAAETAKPSTPPDNGAAGGIIDKGRRAVSAYKKWILAGRPVRSPERIAEIFDTICKPCEFFKPTRNPNDGSCEKCGCSLKRRGKLINKIAQLTQGCPVGKWKEGE